VTWLAIERANGQWQKKKSWKKNWHRRLEPANVPDGVKINRLQKIAKPLQILGTALQFCSGFVASTGHSRLLCRPTHYDLALPGLHGEPSIASTSIKFPCLIRVQSVAN
jgi:hypothetical protein